MEDKNCTDCGGDFDGLASQCFLCPGTRCYECGNKHVCEKPDEGITNSCPHSKVGVCQECIGVDSGDGPG